MKIALASDHGGYALKRSVKEHLSARGIGFDDLGCYDEASCDYPDYGRRAAEAVARGEYDRGLLFCGTGVGISIAANKVRGIRCACCSDCFSVQYARAHNDANLLALGGRVVGAGLAAMMVDLFLDTAFEGGRHQRRVGQIHAIEDGQLPGEDGAKRGR